MNTKQQGVDPSGRAVMEGSFFGCYRGVTRVEVIVVTVICVFILGIFLPLYATLSQRTHQVDCESRMQAVGLGLIQYAQDNNNKFPNGTEPTPGLGWVGQIYPYVKSTKVFDCPDDSKGSITRAINVLSYAYNSNIPKWLTTQPLVAKNFPNPARSVALFEVTGDMVQMTAPDEGAAQGATMFSAAGDGTAFNLHSTMRGADPIHYATGDLGGRPGGVINQFNEARHQGGSEFLMVDGHVKWLKPGQVSTGTDAPTPSAPQTGTITGTAAGTGSPNCAATFSVK